MIVMFCIYLTRWYSYNIRLSKTKTRYSYMQELFPILEDGHDDISVWDNFFHYNTSLLTKSSISISMFYWSSIWVVVVLYLILSKRLILDFESGFKTRDYFLVDKIINLFVSSYEMVNLSV